eukprot:5338790-Amphidinium_carterae.1
MPMVHDLQLHAGVFPKPINASFGKCELYKVFIARTPADLWYCSLASLQDTRTRGTHSRTIRCEMPCT